MGFLGLIWCPSYAVRESVWPLSLQKSLNIKHYPNRDMKDSMSANHPFSFMIMNMNKFITPFRGSSSMKTPSMEWWIYSYSYSWMNLVNYGWKYLFIQRMYIHPKNSNIILHFGSNPMILHTPKIRYNIPFLNFVLILSKSWFIKCCISHLWIVYNIL